MVSTRRAHSSRPLRRVVVLAATGALVVGLSACSTSDIPAQLGIPSPATDSAQRMYSLWQGSWVAAWVVGALTWTLIIGTAVVYRKRSEAAPVQTRYNIPIEVMYTVTPLIVVAVLFFFTARDETQIIKVTNDQQHTVNVVGFQWNWAFNYVDEGAYDVGSPAQLPTLWLPVGEKVKFTLTSPDVIHSFWIPEFLFKMDVIPGRTNQFEVTPTKEGHFVGRCAELCGTYHSSMLFYVNVVSPQAYDQHIAALKAEGQAGSVDTGRTSDAAQNQGRSDIGGSG
jgi:cytochrome c oxidase subunit 2